jgi:hypothetical protein
MVVSFLVAVFFQLIYPHLGGPAVCQWQKLIIGVVITTAAWVTVTLVTRPTDDETLFRFCRLIRAGGPGWKAVEERAAARGTPIESGGEKWEVPSGLLCMTLACMAVYAAMFGIGAWFYSCPLRAACMSAVSVVSTALLFKILSRLYAKNAKPS